MREFRLLCVEDNPNDRELFKLALGRVEMDMDVIFARDGMEAMRCLQESSYSMVLTDLKMPRMDGVELASYIRGLGLPWMPVVMFTTSVAESDVQRAYQSGCHAFHVKPLGFRTLCAALEQILGYWSGVIHVRRGATVCR